MKFGDKALGVLLTIEAEGRRRSALERTLDSTLKAARAAARDFRRALFRRLASRRPRLAYVSMTDDAAEFAEGVVLEVAS